MPKLLALFLISFLSNPILAQNNFNFNCTKDTTIICTTSCITLRTVIPDIHTLTNSYAVNSTSSNGCFKSYADPGTKGMSTNIKGDDIYSAPLDITFPFSFFGAFYNKLVASTNGYLSFDISLANSFSHFGILNRGDSLTTNAGTPQDLPSKLYDKALIMAPYHDLDVSNGPSSTQIKYDVIGIAPYRKWILSYYNVPTYTTACLNLNTNTQQIVLYETLGIVEIFIYDKEICLNWNDGRSIIGMQDITKSLSIMAPGREASSAPWGSRGMNEGWRFVPASGASLFIKSELFDLAGSIIASGVTTDIGNNQLSINFNNVCPTGSGSTYLVKSFYKNPNGSNTEIINIDTIKVIKGDPISAQTTNAGCSPASTGKIEVVNPVGSGYEYSLDGITWQQSNIFTVPAGTYNVRARANGSNCISTKNIVVDNDALSASIDKKISPCPGPISGSIIISPVHGTAPYLYSLNGGNYQTSNSYINLSEGNYTLLIKDAAGCSYSTMISINIVDFASTKVNNTICGKPGSGTIEVTPGFGSPPYLYYLNGGAGQTSNVFNNLKAGVYDILIKDNASCAYKLSATVGENILITANVIIDKPDCLGNANGSFIIHPSSGNAPYQFALNANSFQNDSIFNKLSSGIYLLHIKDALGCIKDTTIDLQQPNLFKITALTTSATTCSSPDGQIFIKANGGTTPYQYSIDTAKTFYLSNKFNSAAGERQIIVKDAKGCTTNGLAIVDAIDKRIKVDLGADKTICAESSIQLTSTIYPNVSGVNWNTTNGLSDSTSTSPIASPSDTMTYILSAKNVVCFGSDTIKVNVLHKPVANAGADTLICNNTSATLRGSATNTSGKVMYSWTPSNDIINPTSAITVVRPKDSRENTYILKVTDNYGCNFTAYDKVKIRMNSPLIAFAGNDTVASIGIPQQLFGSGGNKYFWSPAGLLNNPLIQNPVAALQNDTRFNLTVKDTFGCIGTSSVLIKVYKGATYYVPNAFTPNGDGLNDFFRCIAPGVQQTDYFRIYNRSGQVMYSAKDVTKGWDGNYLGKPQNTGVYVWIIKGLDVTGKIVDIKGTVTLIR